MRCRLAIVAAVALLAAALPAAVRGEQGGAAGKRVLALISSEDMRNTHSQFFQGLRDAGLEVDVRGHKESDLVLRKHDDAVYGHLILFTPRANGFGGSISAKAIVDFADAGGNVLLALAPGASDLMRGLAQELGVEVDAKGTKVFDHFGRQAAGGSTDPTLIATGAVADLPAVFGASRPEGPVLFRGVAQAVPASAELVTVALSAGPTAYSHDPKKAAAEPPLLPAGGSAALVSLAQARNNARAVVAGSLDMFSNELYDAEVQIADGGESFPKSGNRAFTLATALWAFQRRGVLRVSEPRHRVAGGPLNPELYRVNDDALFEIDVLEEADGVARPYKADDLQVSFVMLDPYVRQPLATSGDGTFSLRFEVPDVYGVFKYAIDYSRAGYSYINLQHVVPVRPFRHDEYERFLLPAYPYYASAASTMAAFFLLGLVYLYSRSG